MSTHKPEGFRNDLHRRARALHVGGKLDTAGRVPLETREDLSLAYTPGVGDISRDIAADVDLVWDLTWRSRVVAVISDGTAVLGLGDIGPEAALPVMEGKAALMTRFAGLACVPLVIDETDPDRIVELVAALAPSFGGILLEDISAPRCFEIEQRLQERLSIPVLHDDQHGTAVVVTAGLRSALAVSGRDISTTRVVIVGAGAAGTAIALMLTELGVTDVIVTDSKGIISASRTDLTPAKKDLLSSTNPRAVNGTLPDALAGADVVIGVSGGSIDASLLATMNADPIVFALANPDPEIPPADAARYSRLIATGRSDHPNQVNNLLAFPGMFLGALECGATAMTRGMLQAAARALSDLVPDPTPDQLMPSVFDPRVVPAVAEAVAAEARREGVVRG